MATKKIPYALTDFRLISTGNYYYVDKTRFIEEVERAPRFLFLIRPRRFGKSLWLAVMEMYYGLEYREQFDELFGRYYIGQHPTEERNSYLILKFNFSQVNPELGELEPSFEVHCGHRILKFNETYRELLGEEYFAKFPENGTAVAKFEFLTLWCSMRDLPVYLIIDEYDNFTNVVLSRHGHQKYQALTHCADFFRYFFNMVKGATTGPDASVRRMFISGVSPVTLDDVTSGFNIATMITMNPRFNEILGFTEGEVREMLEYYKAEGCWTGDTDGMLSVMREWYDNYCFSEECCGTRLYNPDMVLYFVNYLTTTGLVPKSLVDANIKTDYGKLRHLVVLDKRLNGNFSRIREIAEEGEVAAHVEPSFPAEELVNKENFTSLLFYFGLLTIDRVEEGEIVLKIPNLTIRQVLFSYFERGYWEAEVFNVKVSHLGDLMKRMAYRGEWRPVFEYFAGEVRSQTAFRDFLQGEKAIQSLHLVYMNLMNYFIIWPEREMNKGFADLWMSPNLLNHPEMRYSYVVEFKYLKHDASDDAVAEKLAEAMEQFGRYVGDAKIAASRGNTTVRYIAVVYRAWELAALEEMPH